MSVESHLDPDDQEFLAGRILHRLWVAEMTVAW
jgi:hypothetical protein